MGTSGTLKLLVQPRADVRPAWLSARLASVLDLPEPEYRRWLRALESDPLFARLRAWPGGPVVRREPLAGARFAWRRLPRASGAEAAEERGFPSPGAMPGLDDELAECVRRIGLEAFERCYLKGDDPRQREAAARDAGLDARQAERVARLVDELWIGEDALAAPASGLGAPVHCVAAIERGADGFYPAYLFPDYLRGRYQVDYAALPGLKAALGAEDWTRARELLRQLELANRKLGALSRIIDALPRLQPEFFASEDPDALRPLRQNAAAAELRLSPSAVCRALAGRAVRTPRGRELALGGFFPSARRRNARLIARAVAEAPEATDEEIRSRLSRAHGLRVTRRLVNLRRREAGL